MSGAREFVFVLSGNSQGIEQASQRANAALKSTTDSTVALDHAQTGAASSTASLVTSLGKIGVAGLGIQMVVGWAKEAAVALTQAQIRADRLSMQMGAAVGQAQARQEIDYIREASNRLGLDLNSTAQSYARFAASARGTSLEGKGQREVFDSVAKASAVMGLNVEESQGVLRALEQMMSKGTVQAEELRGQLGDRLPGALQIAARAMGVTTGELSKMVEKGEVIASEFLPRFARQLELELGGSAERASATMQAATNRVSNAWDLMQQSVAQAGAGEMWKGQLNVLADGMNNVSEAMTRQRDQGRGWAAQMFAATGATLQFLNPMNALGYTAQSSAGQLQQAKEKVAELRMELERNPGNIFLRPAIQEAEELIATLERAKRATINLRALDNAMIMGTERGESEAKARRMDAVRKVTDDLAGATSKLAVAHRALGFAYAAGDMKQEEYFRLANQARKEYGGAPAKPAKPGKSDPISDHFILDVNDARQRQFQRYADADKPVQDFFNAAVQKSDERMLGADERRKQQGEEYARQIASNAQGISASLIKDAETRGQAQLAIEKASLTSRMELLKLNATERKEVEDQIANYVVVRQAQMVEELKPEWQRMVESWENTNVAMKRTSDEFLNGFTTRGRDAFIEFATTGRVSVKGLVQFIQAEFAKMVYDRFLAQAGASLGGSIFGAVFGGGGGLGSLFGGGYSVDTSGAGTVVDAVVRGTRGGAATGSNYVERDMLTILHKGEAVIPAAYNPAAGGGGVGAGGGITFNQVFNVASGASRADMVAAAQAGRQAAVADVADLIRRGNPAFA